jgi:hypothetical protein
MHRRQMTWIARRLVILSAFLLLAATPQIKAQTTSGTLLGLVRDKAGRGLSETKITIENEENGNRRATRTDDAGNYTIFNLPPGAYKITASKDGFREQTIKSFPIQFNQKNVIRLPLFTLLTGALNGKVIDTAGNALPGTRIIAVGKSDNVPHETVANQAGFYSLTDLPFDLYTVTARWSGRRGELIGVSSIFLTPQTESTQFVGVLFPNHRQSELGALSSRLPVTSQAVIQPAQFRRQESTEVGGVISDAWLRDRESSAAPRSNRKVATAAPPKPGQTVQPASEGAGAAALVNTRDAARTSNFSERQINSLPIGGATAMRSFDEFALLVPGVAPPPYMPGVRGPGVGFGIGTPGQFSVNGLRARSNNFSVDGSDNNDPDVGVRRQGFVALVPQAIESVKEISISTLLWDAELGRNFGGQVNAVSKYGGNKYHGQVYAFFTDSRLNARNFFDTQGKTPNTRAQLGLTIGGPIVSKSTQFFFSFERQKTNALITQHFSVPSLRERRLFPNSGFNELHPANHTGVNDAGAGLSGLGETVFSYYPLPNDSRGPYGKNNYTQQMPADSQGLVSSLRLTHQFMQGRYVVNARYNFTDDKRILPSINRAIGSTLGSNTRSHNLSLILDSQLTNSIFNQARFSFGRTRLNFPEVSGSPLLLPRTTTKFPTFDECLYDPAALSCPAGLPPAAIIEGLGELVVEPFSPVGVNAFSFPQGRVNNTFQYADSISWQRRSHSLKFGGEVRRVQLNSFQDRLYRPQVVFSYGLAEFGDLGSLNTGGCCPEFTQEGPASLLTGTQMAALGVPSSIFQSIATTEAGSRIGLRNSELHFFINDNWRVRPNLTLDYGLRYDYNTVFREVNNRIEDAITLRNLPVPGSSSLFNTTSRIDSFNAAVDSYRKVLGGRTRMYDPDKNNFGPHVGFAWDPRSDGKMSIRGGYGIYYDTVLGAVVSQSRNVFPNEVPVNVDPTFFTDLRFLNIPAFVTASGSLNAQVPLVVSPFTNRLSGGPEDLVGLIGYLFEHCDLGAGLAFTLPARKLPTPYAQQWHLTVERELFSDYVFSAAYVGTRGVNLTRLTTPNLGLTITPVIPIALTRFHGPLIGAGGMPLPPTVIGDLISSITKTFAHRPRPVTTLGPYQIFENSASSNYHALQLEARKRYGHNYQFTAAYTWSHAIDDVSDLFPIAGAPVIAQDSFNFRAERGDANFDIRQRFVASLLWDLPFYRNSSSGAGRIFKNWQIASIFQANTGQPFTLNLPVDANLDGNLTDRPSTTDGLVFLTGHGPQRIVLASGRQVTDFFTLRSNGAMGRNTVRGDNFIDLDLSVSRTFKFGETKSLLFRAEFFNALNRANFGLPVRVIGAPGFGSAVDTVVPGRTIVFVLKSAF